MGSKLGDCYVAAYIICPGAPGKRVCAPDIEVTRRLRLLGQSMALRLSVVSDHRQMLGERSSIVLHSGGATIGRSPSNDWVLPDPQRYVSARHARIAWRNGQYFVEDLSTNGVYVNEDERPLGKDVARQLCTGDVLRVGEYQLAVAVEEEPRP